MKKIIITLLFLIPVLGFTQYVQVPTHYDAEATAIEIMKGHIEKYLNDSLTEVVIQKSEDKWVTSYLDKEEIIKKVGKTLQKGKAQYAGRTDGGFRFYITVWDVKDDTEVVGSLDIVIDVFTQQIKSIEIEK
jgi:hypothetical protein